MFNVKSSTNLRTIVREMAASGAASNLRAKYGGSRVDVAYRRFGVDPSTLFRWERGLSVPSGKRLVAYGTWLESLARQAADE